MIAAGSFASTDIFLPCSSSTARDETTPSWLSIVGNATHSFPARYAAYFAASIVRPPPSPTTKSKSESRDASFFMHSLSRDSGSTTFTSNDFACLTIAWPMSLYAFPEHKSANLLPMPRLFRNASACGTADFSTRILRGNVMSIYTSHF